LWPNEDVAHLLARYHEVEPAIQAGSGMPYREVLARSLRAIANEDGLDLAPEDEGALGAALPSWRVFSEVPGALRDLRARGRGFAGGPGGLGARRARGWGFAILPNTDPEFLAASVSRIGVNPDLTIRAAEAGSYKPASGHWEAFRARSGADPSGHVHVGASLYH